MLGVVVIGRNEGERLRKCLQSFCFRCNTDRETHADAGIPIVYVDSGSTDGSVQMARGTGAEVVELDMARPFSAARARNEGLARLLEVNPKTRYVQFVDGDCVLDPAWLATAGQFLEANSAYAAVAGRLRERYPERSVYNRLCDLEWNTPVGDALACGGIAMFRVEAFQAAGGFDPTVIAGEEPELCVRLRQKGWKIRRVDAEMALHDAAMTRFSQWWRRSVRTGYGFAQVCRQQPDLGIGWRRQLAGMWVWAVLLPLGASGLAWNTGGWSLVALMLYPALAYRVYRHQRERGLGAADARLYSVFCVLGKFPQFWGQVKYRFSRGSTADIRQVEYKRAPVVGAEA